MIFLDSLVPCKNLTYFFLHLDKQCCSCLLGEPFYYLHSLKKEGKKRWLFNDSSSLLRHIQSTSLQSVLVQTQALTRKMWIQKSRKGNTHACAHTHGHTHASTHTHPDGAKSRKKNWFIYLISFSVEIPRCLEVSPPPPLPPERNAAGFRSVFAPIKEFKSDTNPESKCLFQMRSWPERRCCSDPERVSKRRPRRLRRHAAQREPFKSLMVGDVLKAASANHYRRCTSRPSPPLSPQLLAAARSAPQSNSGVKCNQLSKKGTQL